MRILPDGLAKRPRARLTARSAIRLAVAFVLALPATLGAHKVHAETDFVIRDGSDEIKPQHVGDDILVVTLRGVQTTPYVITQTAPDKGLVFLNGHGAKKSDSGSRDEWDFHAGLRRTGEDYTLYGTYYVMGRAEGVKAHSFTGAFSLSKSDALVRIPDTTISIRINRLQADKAETAD